MKKPAPAEALEIQGPSGRLEAVLEDSPVGDAIGIGVVCHPHPQHGGTMNNKVAHTLARAFNRSGLAALRFNFRGVGKSEGEFGEGVGDVDDVLAAVEAARERFPGLPLWLGGFSFGAAMAVRAANTANAAGLISVAPAAFRFAGRLDEQPRMPWLIVHGENDELVPIEESVEWVNGLEPGPELVVFPETSHFFHGKLVDLREAVVSFVNRHQSAETKKPG